MRPTRSRRFGLPNFWGAAWLAVLVLWWIPIANARDNSIKSPDEIPGSKKVDAEGLIRAAESIPDMVLVDSRIRADRKQGYIEGSLSLPDEGTTCASLAGVIPAKGHPALFYCNGPKCGRSAKAVRTALTCGYTNVYWFRGGFEEWKTKDYPYVKE